MAEKSLLDKVKGFFSSDDEEEKDTLKAKVAAPPPPDVTTTVSTTKSTKEETPAGSKLENLGISAMAKANKLLDEANTLPAHSRDDFKKRVKDAQDAYEMAESKVEKRELAEKLAHAVTQLGAGLHGLKTGADMSGLKFEKSDWEKKMDRNLAKFRDNLETARDEDRYSMAESQNRRSNLVSQASAASGIGSTYLSAAARDKDAAATSEKSTIKTEMQAGKNYMKKKADFDKFVADLKTKKDVDPDVTVSQLRSRAMALPGVDPAVLDKLVKKAQGWGGLDSADAKDAAAAINDYVASLPTPDFSAAPAAAAETTEEQPPQDAGEVERKDPATGKIAVYDAKTKQFKRWK